MQVLCSTSQDHVRTISKCVSCCRVQLPVPSPPVTHLCHLQVWRSLSACACWVTQISLCATPVRKRPICWAYNPCIWDRCTLTAVERYDLSAQEFLDTPLMSSKIILAVSSEMLLSEREVAVLRNETRGRYIILLHLVRSSCMCSSASQTAYGNSCIQRTISVKLSNTFKLAAALELRSKIGYRLTGLRVLAVSCHLLLALVLHRSHIQRVGQYNLTGIHVKLAAA